MLCVEYIINSQKLARRFGPEKVRTHQAEVFQSDVGEISGPGRGHRLETLKYCLQQFNCRAEPDIADRLNPTAANQNEPRPVLAFSPGQGQEAKLVEPVDVPK